MKPHTEQQLPGEPIELILAENARRRQAIAEQNNRYDPLTGRGCHGKRTAATAPDGSEAIVPTAMLRDAEFSAIKNLTDWERLRCRHDFEFWAARCVTIKDKESGRLVPMCLNRAQRRVLGIMETQRTAGKPVRLIMLKARQWGGSTLVQMYMAWVQCTRLRNWHSLICAQVSQSSANIRGMYSLMLDHYPAELWDGDGTSPALKRFEGQELVKTIAGRDCKITIGSSESQDAIRSGDYAMAHLTEVAFWKDSPKSVPADFVRAICGAIVAKPDTLVVYESTANGMGNFFHSEWERSLEGKSDKEAVFVPWFEIDMYSAPLVDEATFYNSMNHYERWLWSIGATLQNIAWYRNKLREYSDHRSMKAEYPSSADEAFSNTGSNVFATEFVTRMRRRCRKPALVGEVMSATRRFTGPEALTHLSFAPDPTGLLSVWEQPRPEREYVVAVDVGGRTAGADWSVVAVLTVEERPQVVAQWRGHTDHDLLTWKAAMIASWYNDACLAFESNTLESTCHEQGRYILDELFEHYSNLYVREAIDGSAGYRIGFHTNRGTKQMIVTRLIAALRDDTYREASLEACTEFAAYELQPNGTYGARKGFHDDIVMTRAIALHIIDKLRNMPSYNAISNDTPTGEPSAGVSDSELASFFHLPSNTI